MHVGLDAIASYSTVHVLRTCTVWHIPNTEDGGHYLTGVAVWSRPAQATVTGELSNAVNTGSVDARVAVALINVCV